MMIRVILWGMLMPVYAAVHESLRTLPYTWTESSTSVSDDVYMSLSVMLYVNLSRAVTSNADESPDHTPTLIS